MDRLSCAVSRRQALLAAVAAIVAGGPAVAEESPAGTVQTLRGDAFAEGPKPRRALQPTALVFIGDMVETATNSALTMHLGKATIVGCVQVRRRLQAVSFDNLRWRQRSPPRPRPRARRDCSDPAAH